ncbi:MAG: sensor histidine kinase [Hyphomonas sp.]
MAGKADWSLANRLRARALMATAAITLLLSTVVAVHYGSDLPELRHRSLHALAERFAKDAAEAARRDDWDLINRRHPLFRKHPENYAWAVTDDGGRIIAASLSRPSDEEILIAAHPFPDVWTSATDTGGWIGGRAISGGGPGAFIVIEIYEDTAGLLPILIAEEILIHIIVPVLPFTLLLMLGLDATLRQTIAPMRRLSETIVGVHPGGAFEPIDMADVPQEISGIAGKLNETLASLNAALERERRFIAEAAHSLRTPLAALKARLELDGSQAPAEQLKADLDGLVRLTNRLLISADETRFSAGSASQCDLAEIARTIVIQLTPVALSASVDLGMESECEAVNIRGNSDTISQALICLVENALQFTPPGGQVTISVTASPPALTVKDSGAGFEGGNEAARRGAIGGDVHAGLGLRIAGQVAQAHGAQLQVAPAHEAGTTVSLRFPAQFTPSTPGT